MKPFSIFYHLPIATLFSGQKPKLSFDTSSSKESGFCDGITTPIITGWFTVSLVHIYVCRLFG